MFKTTVLYYDYKVPDLLLPELCDLLKLRLSDGLVLCPRLGSLGIRFRVHIQRGKRLLTNMLHSL